MKKLFFLSHLIDLDSLNEAQHKANITRKKNKIRKFTWTTNNNNSYQQQQQQQGKTSNTNAHYIMCLSVCVYARVCMRLRAYVCVCGKERA